MAWHSWMQDPDDLYDGAQEEYVGDQIMCLVDVRAPMVNNYFAEGQGSHLVGCLKLIIEIMKFKIIHGDNSSIGVLFFGTKKFPEDVLRRSNWVEFIKLSVPSAENIHKLQDFVENIHIKFDHEVGHQDPASKASHINEVLWKCNDEFQRCAPKGKKDREFQTRIWIFTNDDSPEDNDLGEQSRIVETSKRFFNNNIPISLWYIDRDYMQESFKISRFYQKLLITGEDDEREELSSRFVRASWRGFEKATQKVREHFYQKRQLYHGVMDIGYGDAQNLIGVQFFSQYKVAKKPLAQKIDAETHEILMSKSEIITETSGRVLSEDEVASSVKQFITIGDGNLVPFSRGFMQELIAEESRARVTQAGTTETTTNAEAPVAKQSLPVSNQPVQPSFNIKNDQDRYDKHGAEVTAIVRDPDLAGEVSQISRAPAPADLGEAPRKEDKEKEKDLSEANKAEFFTSITILYYTTPSALKPELSLSEPLFVVPHNSIRGSSLAFAALHHVMTQRNLIAMVKYCGPDKAQKSPARLAALLPQTLTLDEAAGFNLVKLPFKGDIRANPVPVRPSLLEGLNASTMSGGMSPVIAAEQLIQSFLLDKDCQHDSQESANSSEESQEWFDVQKAAPHGTNRGNRLGAGYYDYLDVEAPALQHFYSLLEGIALKYAAADNRMWKAENDRMLPDMRIFKAPQQKQSIETFKSALQLPDNAVDLVEDKKRKSIYEPGDSTERKVRRVEMDAATLDLLKASDLSRLTVPVLKNHCMALGLPVGGIKSDLIDRIEVKIFKM